MRIARYLPIVMAVTLAFGCGASALQHHAQAASAVRTFNDDAVELVETACEEKSAAAASNTDVTADQATIDSEAVLETCRGIRDGQHAVAEAHTLWVMGLVKALGDDEFELQSLVFLAIAAIRLYAEVIPLAARIDLELPELPPIVQSLTGGDG